MTFFKGVIGTQVSVTGNTTIVIGAEISRKSNLPMWNHATFGISVTSVGTEEFHVNIVGNLEGVQVPIAGISGVVTTTSTLIPVTNERILGTEVGVTQSAIVGVPTPTQIVFGNSSTPGQTYSAVVSAILHQHT